MYNINRELRIGIAPSPLIPTKYARGLKTMNPQLGVEDWDLDFYNDSVALQNPSAADGSEDNGKPTRSTAEKETRAIITTLAIGLVAFGLYHALKKK